MIKANLVHGKFVVVLQSEDNCFSVTGLSYLLVIRFFVFFQTVRNPLLALLFLVLW